MQEQQALQGINALLTNYFDGLYHGDYLALMHNGERWLITNKLFTHVDA